MSKLNRSMRRSGAAALGAAVIALLAAGPAAADDQVLIIGAVASLSGDAAQNGKNWLEGAELAADELNSSGTPVKLIIEDDGTVAARAASAFVKLASVDKVRGAVGGTWDFLAESIYPLARQYRVPFVTPTNPVEVLSAAARENVYVFTNALSMGAEREAIRGFLAEERIKTMALVYINVPYGVLHADLLKEEAARGGAAVLVDEQISYQGFHEGIRLAAQRIAVRSPDLVFVVLNYEGVDFLTRELERLKAGPRLLMTHTLKEAYDFGQSPGRYRRAFGIYPRYRDAAGFSAAFERKFHRPPYDYAASGYDAVMFLARYLRQGAGVDYRGITGHHRVLPDSRAAAETEAVIMGIRDGRLEVVFGEDERRQASG